MEEMEAPVEYSIRQPLGSMKHFGATFSLEGWEAFQGRPLIPPRIYRFSLHFLRGKATPGLCWTGAVLTGYSIKLSKAFTSFLSAGALQNPALLIPLEIQP